MKVMLPVAPEKILVTNSMSDVNPSDWKPALTYAKGATVTHAYGVYLALVDNAAKYPEREPEIWQFMHTSTPEPWQSGKSYAAGDMALYKHQRYMSVKDANLGYIPDTAREWWSCMGPVNSWAAFDRTLNTKAAAREEIRFELDFSRCNAVALFGLEGVSVTLSLRDGIGDIVTEKAIALANFDATSWLDYFLDPIMPREDVIRTDLPVMAYSRLTILISAPEGVARIGHVAVGRCKMLGYTQDDAEAGISDYSRKTTDTFGNTYLAEGAWAKAIRLPLVLDNDNFDTVFRTLASLRATPTVFVGDNVDGGFEALTVWGYVRDFRMVIKGVTHSQCSLEIQGLI